MGMHQDISTYRRMLRVFKHQYRCMRTLTKVGHLAMFCMVYQIWKAINRKLFDKERVDVENIYPKIYMCIELWTLNLVWHMAKVDELGLLHR